MAFCRVLIPLLVLCVVQTFGVEVPVFMWGDIGRSPYEHSALTSIPANEFRKILKHNLVDDPFVVIFIEETLSVEDLSRKIDGETSYPFLDSNVEDSVYLTSVENPLRVLNKVADSEEADHVKLTENGLSAELGSQDERFLFINLKDAKEGESREELLRRHNDFMEDMFVKLQERYGKVLAIYTALNPSWTVVGHSRVRREVETKSRSNTPSVTSLNFRGLKFYFQSATMNNGSDDTTLSGAVGDENSLVNTTLMNSTIIFNNDIKLTLNFESKAGYWFLNNAVLTTPTEEKTMHMQEPASSLFGYSGFSYRCAVNVTLASKEAANTTKEVVKPWTITFLNSRIQPYFNENTTLNDFGDPLNCVGFFTAPIWAGLFVVTVLLAITFFGIMMMMDIRTMDRFDDPKGKTITINASE